MHPLTGAYNCWVVYWPPGTLDRFGNEVGVAKQVLQANWRENATRSIVVDGEQYVVNDVVMTSSETKEGGYLTRVTEVDARDPSTLVNARLMGSGDLAATYASRAVDGQIRSVSMQSTFRGRHKVYTAMI